MSEQLEDIRKICSNYIREYLGEEYDATPWMDKLRLYGIYNAIKIQEGDNDATKVCDSGQNEQKQKKDYYASLRSTWGVINPITKKKGNGKAYDRNKLKREKYE